MAALTMHAMNEATIMHGKETTAYAYELMHNRTQKLALHK